MNMQAGQRVSTDALMKSLFRTKKLNNFMKHYGDRLEDGNISEFLTQYCQEHGRNISKAIRNAQIDRSYGYQIFRGIRMPSRDKLLQLAFGLCMSVEDAGKMLRIAGKSPLYPRIRRDAVLIFCLKEKKSLEEAQELLAQYELSMLGEIDT